MGKKRKSTKQEADSTFFLKLVVFLILGSQWLRIENLAEGWSVPIPIGLLIGLWFASHDHFQIDRKIEYALLLIAAFISFWLPIGIFVELQRSLSYVQYIVVMKGLAAATLAGISLVGCIEAKEETIYRYPDQYTFINSYFGNTSISAEEYAAAGLAIHAFCDPRIDSEIYADKPMEWNITENDYSAAYEGMLQELVNNEDNEYICRLPFSIEELVA